MNDKLTAREARDTSDAGAPGAAPKDRAAAPLPFWRTIYGFIGPYRNKLLLSALCAGVVGVAAALQPLFIKWLIDDAINATGPEGPLPLRAKLIRAAIIVGIFLGVCAMRLGFGLYGYRRMADGLEGFLCALRGRFFRHVQHLCLRFHDEVSSGELFNYIMGSPVQSLRNFLSQAALNIPIQAVTWVVAIATLAAFNLPMTLISLATVVAMVWLNHRSRRKIREMSAEFMQTESYVSKYVADMLRGCRTIKVYAIEDEVSGSFDGYVDQIRSQGVSLAYRRHIEAVKAEGVRYLGTAVIFLCGAWNCLYREMSAGNLTAFVVSINLLMQPLMQLMELNLIRGNAEAGLERISRILKRVQTTGERPADESKDIRIAAAAAEDAAAPCLSFEKVSFGYEDQRPVLRDLELEIPHGQSVALVGPSGSGKTTFISLLLRLYDPQQGRIVLNGENLRDYPLKDLRSSYGVVPQDPYLFQGTIRDNIRVTRPDADEADIRQAMRTAYVDEFVDELPQRELTRVGEGGSNLSGGQKQRIAIARVALARPLYYIFDEATSALDNRSERRIQQAMETLTAGHTSFIIAHRLSTIRNADRILVFEDGRVVQDGDYESLSAAEGLFRKMLNQFAQ